MKIKSLVCLLLLSALSCNTFADFSTATGFGSGTIYSPDASMGGITYDDGSLYVGQTTNIVTVDLSDNSSQVTGILPNAVTNAMISRYNGTTYTAYADISGYSSPHPYMMGYIDGSGVYQNQLDENGIWDMAINSAGDAYIVADPTGSGQSQIFEYDLGTGATTLAATVGGYAGGLAFDSEGNLYYAEQTNGSILKFSVSGLGILDMSSSASVLGVYAGFIGFDKNDNFYATTGYGASFSQYDLSLGTKVVDIASASIGSGINQFAFNGDSIYMLYTDWSVGSTVYEVSAVPEPATMLLMTVGGLLVRRKRS